MGRVINGFQIVVLIVFIFYAEFYKLGELPFRVWDESRLITAAYEITKNGKFLTPTVDNEIDMWNTKPPLMIWAEACCIKLSGFSEFSVRFPAAVCGTLAILIVVLFVFGITHNRWSALLSGIVLCTAKGYIAGHTTRVAEYDSMLMLFITSYLIAFFLYTESGRSNRNKYLLLFFATLTLAALTKGIASLLFAPPLFIYLPFRKQLKDTLFNRYFYLGLGIFIVFAAGYYLLREHYNPGYIKAVSENELGGRFNSTQGGEPTPWNFYLTAIRFYQFGEWYWALPMALISILFLQNPLQKRLMAYCFLNAILFLAVLSCSQTKMVWYDLPVFPLFAIIIAILFFQLSELMGRALHISKSIIIVLLIIIFSIVPVREALGIIHWKDNLQADNFYAASYYLRDGVYGKRDLNNTIYFSADYNIQWRLYVKMLNERGVRIEDHPYYGTPFKAGDKLIANQDKIKALIEKSYDYTILDEFYGVKEYRIIAAK